MATIRFQHPDHPDDGNAWAPWNVDEIVTVRISAVNADGSYEAETMETWPPDLREQHEAELTEARRQAHEASERHRYDGGGLFRASKP